MAQVFSEAEHEALNVHVRELLNELEDSADYYAYRRRVDRQLEMTMQREHGSDHSEIQQHRRERRGEEHPQRIQHAHAESGERHEKDVREHHAVEAYRDIEGFLVKAVCE